MFRRFLLLTLFIPSALMAADQIKVKVTGFNATDEAKIKKAAGIVFARWGKKAVIECIYKNVKRRWALEDNQETKLTRNDLETGGLALFIEYTLKPGGIVWDKSKVRIVVEGQNLGDGVNGMAQVPYKPATDKQEYLIALNTKNVSKRTEEQVAGTIFHEMLHNIGEKHGDVGTYDQKYAGFLIKEWGQCLAGNGTPNFGLGGDPYEAWDE